jgi:tRNA(Ile)-lysidine synthase
MGDMRPTPLELTPTTNALPGTCGLLAAYSGGLDSSVLLHRLAGDPAARARGLRAIHVHHGLHAQAAAWAAHCERTCAAYGVPLQVARVAVERDAGLGVEGAARSARHGAFAAALGIGEVLALAHHRDDQAETFLLRALRGSGVDGLAAMRAWRPYAAGWLWRPLLGAPRDALLAYARLHQLEWIEDPSNAQDDAARNFLRLRVLPLLRERWPHADAALARSADLAAEAAQLLDTEDAHALAALRCRDGSLDIAALRGLSPARRARLLRRWVADLGLPPLPARALARVEHELLAARADAQACVDWTGAWIRAWRGALHAGRPAPRLPTDWEADWDGRAPMPVPAGGTLALVGCDGFDTPLRIHQRRGGERLRLPGRVHSHALKHLLQDAGIPPWQRDRLPLLSSPDGTLLAAGDALLSADFAAWLDARGARLRWSALA